MEVQVVRQQLRVTRRQGAFVGCTQHGVIFVSAGVCTEKAATQDAMLCMTYVTLLIPLSTCTCLFPLH